MTGKVLTLPLAPEARSRLTAAAIRRHEDGIQIGDMVYSAKHDRQGMVKDIDIDVASREIIRFHVLFPTFERTWPVDPHELSKITGAA